MRPLFVQYAARSLSVAMLATVLPAQQPPPAAPEQSGFTIKATSDLVLVNLVVRDRKGNPVRGLKRADFTVLEDGKPQRLSSFDVEEVETAVTAAPAAAEATPAAPPAKPEAPTTIKSIAGREIDSRNKRLIVIFFDFSGMEAEEIELSVDAAENYVEHKMTPADLVAVASFNTVLKIDQDFTADKALIRKALARYGASSGSAGQEAGSTGDTEGTAENGNAFSADDSDFNTYNTDRKLQALQSLAGALAKIEQKKSIIYFSGALTRGIDNQAQLRATVDAAVKANVAIYSVDAPGLEALPPGGSAETASLRGTSAFSGAAMRNQYDQNFGGSETLVTLAEDTGGKAFIDTNDFGGVFDKVQDDTSAYYILAYRSANLVKDGRFRKITVKTSLKDVKLDYRSGYYAGKDFAHFNKSDREEQMGIELDSELPATDVMVYLAASYFRLSDDRFYVPVSLIVPGSQIPFSKASDKDKATLDVIGQVREADIRFPIANVRDTVHLAVDQNQNVARKNVQYNTGFILAPGKYRVKFVIRENQSGRLGSFETELTVPDLKKLPQKNAVRMSSIVLGSQRQQAVKAQKENPLVRDGQELVPNITHVFTADQHMYLYYEVYDPAKAQPPAETGDKAAPRPKNPVRVISSVQFFAGNVKAFETPALEVRELAADRRAAVFQLDVPVEKLRAGYYTCQVNVIDDTAGSFTFPRFPILVKPKAPVPQASAGGR